MALESTGAADGASASGDNQAALEARFNALYEQMMEKQISFKEATEPGKVDQQLAGKG